MDEVEKLIEIYQQLEEAGLMVTAGKKDAAELMVSHDVVPVVRCKDCKFLHDEHGCTKFGHDYSYPVVLVNDFCSFGERRTDAETMGK